MEKITVIIPCLNEEKAIRDVINRVPVDTLRYLGYITEIIVIDNNSSDHTSEVARREGARVIFEKNKGKGNAIKTGFEAVDDSTKYVVMLDGDNTYKANEIPRLVEPLANNFCDVIVGSRLGGKTAKNSFKLQNRIVNWAFTFLVRQFYGANITDVLSGYFAWKKEVVDELKIHLKSNGFAIEMEMITKMVKLGNQIYSVPITYDQRQGETKINSLKDGARIFKMFLNNLVWSSRKSYNKKLEEDTITSSEF